jgi:hypothetical protein
VVPALATALQDADIENAIQLGLLLKRLAGSPIEGLMLERADETREGIVWRLRELGSGSVSKVR